MGNSLGFVLFSLYLVFQTRYWFWDKTVYGYLCLLTRKTDTEDTLKLQKYQLGCWARKWGMRFQPVKCNMMMQILNKETDRKDSCFIYFWGNGPRKCRNLSCSPHKYFKNDLRLNTHVSNLFNICTKTNRTLHYGMDSAGLTVDSYCYTKVWRVKPVYQQMTFSSG